MTLCIFRAKRSYFLSLNGVVRAKRSDFLFVCITISEFRTTLLYICERSEDVPAVRWRRASEARRFRHCFCVPIGKWRRSSEAIPPEWCIGWLCGRWSWFGRRDVGLTCRMYGVVACRCGVVVVQPSPCSSCSSCRSASGRRASRMRCSGCVVFSGVGVGVGRWWQPSRTSVAAFGPSGSV